MAHALMNLLVLGLMLFACIVAFAKKQRLLCLGLLLLSLSGFFWAGLTTYPYIQSELAEAIPSLYIWFLPILGLIQAAGWSCVLFSVFKLPKAA